MSLMQVGVSKDAIIEARKSIIEILKCTADQDTKKIALQTLTQICKVENTTVSNCSFIHK